MRVMGRHSDVHITQERIQSDANSRLPKVKSKQGSLGLPAVLTNCPFNCGLPQLTKLRLSGGAATNCCCYTFNASNLYASRMLALTTALFTSNSVRLCPGSGQETLALFDVHVQRQTLLHLPVLFPTQHEECRLPDPPHRAMPREQIPSLFFLFENSITETKRAQPHSARLKITQHILWRKVSPSAPTAARISNSDPANALTTAQDRINPRWPSATTETNRYLKAQPQHLVGAPARPGGTSRWASRRHFRTTLGPTAMDTVVSCGMRIRSCGRLFCNASNVSEFLGARAAPIRA